MSSNVLNTFALVSATSGSATSRGKGSERARSSASRPPFAKTRIRSESSTVGGIGELVYAGLDWVDPALPAGRWS